MSVLATVGLGSNLGDRRAHLAEAVRELDALAGSHVTAESSCYETAPVGSPGQPDFLNAVIDLRTSLPPLDLLRALLSIERSHGRQRAVQRNPDPLTREARTLDLDLLLYGGERIAVPELTLPHPRMHERAFVLMPLAEIDPGRAIGGLGTASELLARLPHQRLRRLD